VRWGFVIIALATLPSQPEPKATPRSTEWCEIGQNGPWQTVVPFHKLVCSIVCAASSNRNEKHQTHLGHPTARLNQQVRQLYEREKYQEAIPIAERAVEVAKRAFGLEQPETASELDNLGFLFQKIGEYAKAEPLSQEALRIRQKVLGPEHPDTATSLNDLGSLYWRWATTQKPNHSFKKRSESGRRSWALNIPTRRAASIIWPRCTRIWASTPKRLFGRLTAAPYRRWTEIGDGTHMVVLEKNRWQVLNAVTAFLNEVVPRGCPWRPASRGDVSHSNGHAMPLASDILIGFKRNFCKLAVLAFMLSGKAPALDPSRPKLRTLYRQLPLFLHPASAGRWVPGRTYFPETECRGIGRFPLHFRR
jgi:hypothetical protein